MGAVVALAFLAVPAAVGYAVLAFAAILLVQVLLLRPGSAALRSHDYLHTTPPAIVALVSWTMRVAERLAGLVPATLACGRLGTQFMQSQVLFTLSNLGVPDALAAAGTPQTAAQLAASLNSAHGWCIPAAWLDRLLTAAAWHGMLTRVDSEPSKGRLVSWLSPLGRASALLGREVPTADSPAGPEPADVTARVTLTASAGDGSALVSAGKGSRKAPPPGSARDGLPPGPAARYRLNAVSACLVSHSPGCMKDFCKLLEDDYAAAVHLTEGLKTNTVPFELSSPGGATFWEHLASSPRHAKTFDVAMQQKRHIGGTGIVKTYDFGRFDTLIDIAGGVGEFSASVLAEHPRLRAVVVDQEAQIARGKQIWATQHAALADRVTLSAGNMFDASSLPAPPAGSRATGVVLYDVLHNWSDADALAILRNVRVAVGAGKAGSSGEVQLLLLETTKSPELLGAQMPVRCTSDLLMLTLFGDGKERDTTHFASLLAQAGWRLQRLVPGPGAFQVVEAVPV